MYNARNYVRLSVDLCVFALLLLSKLYNVRIRVEVLEITTLPHKLNWVPLLENTQPLETISIDYVNCIIFRK